MYLVTFNALKPAKALTVAMVEVFAPTLPLKLSKDKEIVGTGGSSFLQDENTTANENKIKPARAGNLLELVMLNNINM
jgi:allophanate hydrolase subunit 2